MRPFEDTTNGWDHTGMMSKKSALAHISAYVAEIKLIAVLEAGSQEMMDVEATVFEVHKEFGQNDQEITSESLRLDCIYDDKPLRFDKDPLVSTKMMQAQDPLEELYLGDGTTERPNYISYKLDSRLKPKVIDILREFKDCFAWDYHEMLGLSRDLVELKLPIESDKRLVKQTPRRFALEARSKIKAEIKLLLKNRFIRPARYVKRAS